ncbi:unnamed protein product [Brugia timori]|uniref:Mannose-6-phosphate isomerase n=1 Tax=Brugia timori TaxID=42155 RepID=A0A0R3QCL2_9BILA|nr:unnamed protein product [Brugia timori]
MLPCRVRSFKAFLRKCQFYFSLHTVRVLGTTQIDAHVGVGERDVIRFETGHIARLADGAVVVSQGETSVS